MSALGPRTSALIAFLAALVGCGDDEGRVEVQGGTDTAGKTTTGAETAPSPAAGNAAQTIRVRETEFALAPRNPRIARTGVVEFVVTNAGGTVHALEVEEPGGEQETEAIDPGRRVRLRVNLSKAGRYEWYCPIGDHRERGMEGELVVAGGGGAPAEDRPRTTQDDSGTTEDDSTTSEEGDDRGRNRGPGGGGY